MSGVYAAARSGWIMKILNKDPSGRQGRKTTNNNTDHDEQSPTGVHHSVMWMVVRMTINNLVMFRKL